MLFFGRSFFSTCLAKILIFSYLHAIFSPLYAAPFEDFECDDYIGRGRMMAFERGAGQGYERSVTTIDAIASLNTIWGKNRIRV